MQYEHALLRRSNREPPGLPEAVSRLNCAGFRPGGNRTAPSKPIMTSQHKDR